MLSLMWTKRRSASDSQKLSPLAFTIESRRASVMGLGSDGSSMLMGAQVSHEAPRGRTAKPDPHAVLRGPCACGIIAAAARYTKGGVTARGVSKWPRLERHC